jgi:transposase
MHDPIERRKFDKEFKQRAVRLVIDGGRPAAVVARELGISASMLHRWKREYLRDRDGSFPGKGHLSDADEEMRRLKKEIADLKEERDILKKAVAFFAKHPD